VGIADETDVIDGGLVGVELKVPSEVNELLVNAGMLLEAGTEMVAMLDCPEDEGPN